MSAGHTTRKSNMKKNIYIIIMVNQAQAVIFCSAETPQNAVIGTLSDFF